MAAARSAPGQSKTGEPWREKLYVDWHLLKVPPITPYTGPLQRRGPGIHRPSFTGCRQRLFRLAAIGHVQSGANPRKINPAFENAVLEDWQRMGYNTAYKGNTFTFRSGRWLKQHGMLGAIDQTVWATRSEPPLSSRASPASGKMKPAEAFSCPRIPSRRDAPEQLCQELWRVGHAQSR